MLTQCLSQTTSTVRYFPQTSTTQVSINIDTTPTLTFSNPIGGGCFSLLSLTRRPNFFSMASGSNLSNGVGALSQGLDVHEELDRFAEVANAAAEASGVVLRKYFRSKFEILDKEDLSEFFVFLCFVWLLRK